MEWTNISYNIITDFSEEKIVLQKKDNEYKLIEISTEEDFEIYFKINELTGLNSNLLYFTDLNVDIDNKKEELTLLSITKESNLKKGFEWFNINSLPENFNQKKNLETWLNLRNKNFIIPWFNKTWFENAKKEITKILNDLNYKKIKNIFLYYSSGISCVLKIETEKSYVFCKRVLPNVFFKEPQLTNKLYELFPEDLPEIIYSTNDTGYIITKDFGTNILGDNKDFNFWIKAVKKLAQLQIKAIKHKDLILENGAFDRSSKKMPDIILNYLNQENKIYLNESDKTLNSEEKTKLINNIDKIKDLYQKLDSYNIPETIEHGDLHSGNIALQNNRIIFYDWSDCAISNPFMSLRSFLWNFIDKDGNIKNNMEEFPDIKNPYTKIVDAYLSEWLEFNTMQNLKEAFNLSQKLAWLSVAVQYIQLVDSMEEHTKFQYKGTIAKGFRKLLSFL